MDDVLAELCDKLVRRHPHVFGEKKAKNAPGSGRLLELAEEKGEKGKARPGGSAESPAFSHEGAEGRGEGRPQGIRLDRRRGGLRKVREELSELSREIESGNLDRARGEWGDLVFSMASLARHLGIDAETASHEAVGKFSERFSLLEKAAEAQGGDMDGMSAERLDRLWEEAKKSRP